MWHIRLLLENITSSNQNARTRSKKFRIGSFKLVYKSYDHVGLEIHIYGSRKLCQTFHDYVRCNGLINYVLSMKSPRVSYFIYQSFKQLFYSTIYQDITNGSLARKSSRMELRVFTHCDKWLQNFGLSWTVRGLSWTVRAFPGRTICLTLKKVKRLKKKNDFTRIKFKSSSKYAWVKYE